MGLVSRGQDVKKPSCMQVYVLLGLFLVYTTTFVSFKTEARVLQSKSLLCVDSKCETLYGTGHTTVRYPSAHKDLLSFKKDVPVNIYGKTEDKQYLFVEINNSRGFVPAKHILEDTISNPELTTKVELNSKTRNQSQPNDSVVPTTSAAAAAAVATDASSPSSESSIASSAASETPVLENTPSSLINDQPDSAFVYTSKSPSVIEGTTFYDADLLKTATPSPTFPEAAVTKTATIEAEFTDSQIDQKVLNNEKFSNDNAAKGKVFSILQQNVTHASVESGIVSVPKINESQVPESILKQNNESESVSIDASSEQEVTNENNNETDAEKMLEANSSVAQIASKVNISDSQVPSTVELASLDSANTTDIVSEKSDVFQFQSNNSNEQIMVNDEQRNESKLEMDHETKFENEDLNILPALVNSSENNETILEHQIENESNLSQHHEHSNVSPGNVAPTDSIEFASKPVVEPHQPPHLSPVVIRNEPNTESTSPTDPAESASQQAVEHHHPLNLSPDVIQNKPNVESFPPTDSAEFASKSVVDPQQQPNLPEVVIRNEPNTESTSPTDPAESASKQEGEHHQPPNLSADVIQNKPNVESFPPTDSAEFASKSVVDPQQQPNLPEVVIRNEPNTESLPLKDSAKFASKSAFEHYLPPNLPNIPPVVIRNEQNAESLPPMDSVKFASKPAVEHHQQPNLPNIPPVVIRNEQNAESLPPMDSASKPAAEHNQQPTLAPVVIQNEQNTESFPKSIGSGNYHVDAKVISPNSGEQHSWEQHDSLQDKPEIMIDTAPSYPASDVHIDPRQYSVNDNGSRRRLFAQKLGFVSVIKEIIPDEVELFFEGISPHAIMFTSIIGMIWCCAKMLISIFSSSRKVNELRDLACQAQRKLFFFESTSDSLKKENITLREKDEEYKKRLNKLNQELEHIKNENQFLKNDNKSLRTKANDSLVKSSELNNTLKDLEDFKLSNYELEQQIENLKSDNYTYKESIQTMELEAQSYKDQIKDLNRQVKELSSENMSVKAQLTESEQQFVIIHAENQDLKLQQNQLKEDVRNLKDETLSLQDKVKQAQEESCSNSLQLEEAKNKIIQLLQELENKNSELVSMQALLNKLNRNISKEQNRRQSSIDMNGDDPIDSINGEENHSENISSHSTTSPELADSEHELQNIIKLQLKLTNIELEKQQLLDKLTVLQTQLDETKKNLQEIENLNVKLKEETDTAIKERTDAVVELDVLKKYFEGKELLFSTEISKQKVKREMKEEEATSLVSRMELVQEENETLKHKLKIVESELEKNDIRYKSQINKLEKQAYENWYAAQSAEKRYEDAKTEATALRHILTKAAKSPPPSEFSISSLFDDTGSSVSADGLNTSFPLPLPPPPPLPLLMMMNPLNHQPPPTSLPTASSQVDLNNSSYWTPSNVPPPPPLPTSNVNTPNNSFTGQSSFAMDLSKSAAPSLNEPAQSTPTYVPQPAYGQAQQSNQGSNAPLVHSTQAQTSNTYQYSSVPVYNQWDNINRNSSSPALSQRSITCTPQATGGGMSAMPPTSVTIPNSPAVQVYGQQQQHPQQVPLSNVAQHQQYAPTPLQHEQQPHHYNTGLQPLTSGDTSAVSGNQLSSFNQANPYSINSSSYHQTAVAPNVGNATVNTTTTAYTPLQSQQSWTATSYVQHHQGNVNASYGQPFTQSPQQQQQLNGSFSQVPLSDSNSRPASVHTQMV